MALLKILTLASLLSLSSSGIKNVINRGRGAACKANKLIDLPPVVLAVEEYMCGNIGKSALKRFAAAVCVCEYLVGLGRGY